MKYIIKTEISQDGEYTSTFMKDKEGRDIRIGNLEGDIISELQSKLSLSIKILAKALNKNTTPDEEEVYDSLKEYI